jgi:S-methylmethionine-dependent homocysteine/selenocysteine methylase
MLVLDGALGTELERRGVNTSLPLWSARALIVAPEVVRQVHRDYLAAGADILTTNTFRTQRRTLTRAGLGARTRELTQLAVRLAREAIKQSGRAAYLTGSMSPLEDCYSPSLVPPDDALRAEHLEMAQNLAGAGCDLLLVETMNTIREAVIATSAAQATGLPVCVSVVVGLQGRPPDTCPARYAAERCEGQLAAPVSAAAEPVKLLSGESITAAVKALRELGPDAIMVNCTPLACIEPALEELRAAWPGPIGLYANVGHADDAPPQVYAQHARRWIEHGARIVGGCCGTSPAHIAAVRAQVDQETRAIPPKEGDYFT